MSPPPDPYSRSIVMMLTMKANFPSSYGLRVDRQHWAGPQLDRSVGSRAENSTVHGFSSTRRHNYEARLRFRCVSNNLLVRFSEPYRELHTEILALRLVNQFVEFLCTRGNDRLRSRHIGDSFGHVQQSQLRAIFFS